MKAISLWQPWASLIGRGKSIETRSWATSYRGPIAIHAAKHWTWRERNVLCNPPVRARLLDVAAYLAPVDMTEQERTAETARLWGRRADDYLPFGAVVAVAHLAGCVRSELFERFGNGNHADGHTTRWDGSYFVNPCEFEFGDLTPGRYGWLLEGIRILCQPVPFKGSQGFFDVPDSLLAEVQP